jgi:hypothetical protein
MKNDEEDLKDSSKEFKYSDVDDDDERYDEN